MRLLIAVLLALVACSPPAMAPTASSAPEDVEYNRREWGSWRDADKDCQDARQEVLIRQSEEEVTFKDGKTCKVATGHWTCPYTGNVFTDPSKLDVDHMVPISEAHKSGGWEWDREKKREYYNDLTEGHLIAVSASSNRSKGSREPGNWMPPRTELACEYLKNWMNVKEKWELEMDCDEARAVAKKFASSCKN